MSKQTFGAELLKADGDTTGLVVPDEVVDRIGLRDRRQSDERVVARRSDFMISPWTPSPGRRACAGAIAPRVTGTPSAL